MQDTLFNLTDEQFFKKPVKNEDEILNRISELGYEGEYIGAPFYIDMNKHHSIPLLIVYRASFKDIADLSFQKHSLLCLLDIDRDVFYCDIVIENQFDRVPAKSGSCAPIPVGFSSRVYQVDIRERLDVPLQVGNYLVRVVHFDKISNGVTMSVGNNEYNTPELIAGYIKKSIEKKNPGYKKQVDTVHNKAFFKHSMSPDVPEKPGINLNCTKEMRLKDSDPPTVYGAYNFSFLSDEISPNLSGEQPYSKSTVYGVICGKKSGFITTFSIDIWVYEKPIVMGGNLIPTGFFSIELDKIPGFKATEQEYVLRIFHRTLVSDALKFKFTAK